MLRAADQPHTETAAALILRPDFEQLHLDEVERALKCASRTCHGRCGLRSYTMGRPRALSAGWRRRVAHAASDMLPSGAIYLSSDWALAAFDRDQASASRP